MQTRVIRETSSLKASLEDALGRVTGSAPCDVLAARRAGTRSFGVSDAAYRASRIEIVVSRVRFNRAPPDMVCVKINKGSTKAIAAKD